MEIKVSQILGALKANDTNTLALSTYMIPPRDNGTKSFCSHTLKICGIFQGSGIWVIGDKTYDIREGDIFLLNNSEYRTVRVVYPPAELKMLILEFEPRFVWSNKDAMFDSNYLKAFFDRNEYFENRIGADTPLSASVFELMQEIGSEINGKLPEYKELVKVKLMNLLVLLNRHFHNAVNIQAKDFLPEQKYSTISRALNYIDGHLDEEITLSELAGMFYMTPAYFSKFFKKYNGIGFSQYISKKRILKSITLLKTTDLSVLEISNLCGFNNTANFYKAFKKFTDQVPSDFRYTEIL